MVDFLSKTAYNLNRNILLLSTVPGIVLVGMISLVKEFTDRTGFSVLDIVAALIGCATVEVALLIGIVAGILSV